MSGCQKTPARREGVPSPAIISKRRNKEILTQTAVSWCEKFAPWITLHAWMMSALAAAGYFKIQTPEKWHASAGDKQLIISSHLGMYGCDLGDPSTRHKSAVGWMRPRGTAETTDESHNSPDWDFLCGHLDGDQNLRVFVPNSKSRNVNSLCLFNATFLARQLYYNHSSSPSSTCMEIERLNTTPNVIVNHQSMEIF